MDVITRIHTGFSMPDTDERAERFGQAEGCGHPVAHLLCLFDAATGLLAKAVLAQGDTHDMATRPTHTRP